MSIVEYFDNAARALVRLLPDGKMVYATMTAGPQGMAMAQFAGEEAKETECPNLLVQPVVFKRPAGVGAGEGASATGKANECGVVKGKEEEERVGGQSAQSKAPREAKKGVKAKSLVKQPSSGARKLLYSKVYHQVQSALLKARKDVEAAKEEAKEQARAAVKSAELKGEFQ